MKVPAGVERIDTRLVLAVLVAVILAVIWVLTLYQLDHARNRAIVQAQRDALGMARVFAAHAVRTIEAADQALIHLRFRYRAQGKALDVNADLRDGLHPGQRYILFSIVDAAGNAVLASRPFAPTNLLDREHVRVQIPTFRDDLFISKPVLGRVSHQWSIQLTRRISRPDGSFNGVVVASLDPSSFTRLYGEVELGPHSAVSLVGADGVVRADRVGPISSFGRDIRSSTVFGRISGKSRGVFFDASPEDGVVHLLAFEKLPGYPLFMVVRQDRDALLADYVSRRDQALALAGGASAVIVLFCAALIVLIGRLMSSRARAIASSQAKSRFLSIMSHELRTPLNGILGFAGLLLDVLREPQQIEFAAAVDASGRRLLGMIDAVLELSALDGEQPRLDATPVPLPALLEQALRAHRGAAAAKGLHLALRVDAGVPAQVVCDSAALVRVLGILLDNAVGFTSTGGVELHVAHKARTWRFVVSDSGVGVPLAHQASIFGKFAAADDRPNRPRGGAGLGLPIAVRLLARMGGALSLDSAPGQGAAFMVTLPAPVAGAADPAGVRTATRVAGTSAAATTAPGSAGQ